MKIFVDGEALIKNRSIARKNASAFESTPSFMPEYTNIAQKMRTVLK
jgi:hypothetical protein